MVSIQSQVSNYIKKNPRATLKNIYHDFDTLNRNTIKSAFNRAMKDAPKYAIDASSGDAKITMDMVEKLIVAGKTPVPSLRVMVDFLKIKQQDHSELEEIDLELFYKKALED